MPPLGGIVDLRDDAGLQMQLSSNIGRGIASGINAFRFNKEKKFQETLQTEMVGLLNQADREGWDGAKTLDALNKIPNIAQSKMYQQMQAARVQQLMNPASQYGDAPWYMNPRYQGTEQAQVASGLKPRAANENLSLGEQVYAGMTDEQKAAYANKMAGVEKNKVLTIGGKPYVYDYNTQTARQIGGIDYTDNKKYQIRQLADGRLVSIDPETGQGNLVGIEGAENAPRPQSDSRAAELAKWQSIYDRTREPIYQDGLLVGFQTKKGQEEVGKQALANISALLNGQTPQSSPRGTQVAQPVQPAQTPVQPSNAPMQYEPAPEQLPYQTQAQAQQSPFKELEPYWRGMSQEEQKTVTEYLNRGGDVNKIIQRMQSTLNRYGNRNDGTAKGQGYFGALSLPDGRVATEYSVGVEFDGKEVEIPTLIPTLTEQEKKIMLNDIIPNGKQPPREIINKAVAHARKRMSEGKSPFAEAQAPDIDMPNAKPQAANLQGNREIGPYTPERGGMVGPLNIGKKDQNTYTPQTGGTVGPMVIGQSNAARGNAMQAAEGQANSQPSGGQATDGQQGGKRKPEGHVPPEDYERYAKEMGLALRTDEYGRTYISGIDAQKVYFNTVTDADFARAFEEKQKDFLRRQSDPLNAERMSDIEREFGGENDQLGLQYSSNERDQYRRELAIKKAAQDRINRLRGR